MAENGNLLPEVYEGWRKYVAENIEHWPKRYVCACCVNPIRVAAGLDPIKGRPHKPCTVKDMGEAIDALDKSRAALPTGDKE